MNDGEPRIEFDYVIVGAGPSAMGLLLGLLTKNTAKNTTFFRIAVIERGSGPSHCANTKSPAHWPDAAATSSSSVTLLKTTIGNRVLDVPTGRGLGGTTNINACLCTPPAAVDFETWPDPWRTAMMGSAESILQIMFQNGALVHHHTSVPSTSSIREANEDLKDSLGDSLWTEAVYPQFITKVPLAASKSESGEFTRRNYHEALIEPLLKANPHLNENITWYKNTEAQRLVFVGDIVTGVECHSRTNGFFHVSARREVILSAGTFESAALLLVSGIGRDDDLDDAGIEPRGRGSEMGVGRNLTDHPIIPKFILTPWTIYSQSPNTVQALMQLSSGDDRFQILFADSTCFTQLGPSTLASNFRTKVESKFLNKFMQVFFLVIRFVVRIVVTYGPLYYLLRHCLFGMNVKLMNPKSRGRVWLTKTKSSQTKPLRRKDVIVNVDSCYFTDERDFEAIQKGWNLCHEYCDVWCEQGVEVLPGNAIKKTFGDDWFRHFVVAFCLPYYHWCGTCSMVSEGKDDWVVDSSLKVKYVKGLRVCDASVFPSIVTGPTALTCAALGFEFASLLLNEARKKFV
jgi:choline dehydrogenase